jgi:hypothetical protein
VISCAVGPTVAADAPLASDNDNPAAPNNGTAHARCFRFEACFARDMAKSSYTFGQYRYRTLGKPLRGSVSSHSGPQTDIG